MISNLFAFFGYVQWFSWQFKHILFKNPTWFFLTLILFLKELFSLLNLILPLLLLLDDRSQDEWTKVTVFHQSLKLLCYKFKDNTFTRWYLCSLCSLSLCYDLLLSKIIRFAYSLCAHYEGSFITIASVWVFLCFYLQLKLKFDLSFDQEIDSICNIPRLVYHFI